MDNQKNKTSIYYQTFYGRSNKLKEAFLGFFFNISSFPRLVIEVILRSRLGCRYFSTYHAARIIVFMLLIPFLIPASYQDGIGGFLQMHWGWFLYLGVFTYCARKRHKETWRRHGEYDFTRFSLSAGDRLPFIDNFRINGKRLDPRTLNVYIEPLFVAAVGCLALLVGQGMLAVLLLVCSVIYSISYSAAFEMGRQIILDQIDMTICNQGLTEIFIHDQEPTNGFEFYGPKPTVEEVRKGIAPLLVGQDFEEGTELK